MESQSIIPYINKDLDTFWPEDISLQELKDKLARYINELARSDFERLVNLLYRIDVSEQKLKTLLKEHAGEHTGNIIAGLIIERQLEKLKTRRQFSRRDNDMNEEELL